MALIAGPTASGKTALALELARHRPTTIINADSAQVYADLPVLSAQPSPDEMETAPHRLFGYLDGGDSCSAARWASDAKVEIAAAHDSGRLPVLVGGTGLYLRTLLDGIAPVPVIDESIRQHVRALDADAAHTALAVEDPQMAARLNPADRSRIQRALEVIRSTGKSIAEWRLQKSGGIAATIALRPVLLLPPRAWLFERCDARFVAMVEQGAVAEVERLLLRKLPADAPVMRAIGVPEISAWLAGQIDRETMLAHGQLATRRYAKRQYTWFRNQSPGDWPRIETPLNSANTANIVIKLQS